MDSGDYGPRHGSDSDLAKLGERRLAGAALAQVGAAVALEGAMGAGAGRGGDRAARRPRLRVLDSAEEGGDRAELQPRASGREHGTLEFHLAPPPGAVLRPPGVLPDMQ